MPGTVDPLVLDLLEWVAREPRPYSEVMEAWRTSCPRLTIWEDASERGYLESRSVAGRGIIVFATEAGHDLLRAAGRASDRAYMR